jgi:hypothetical protein
MLEEIEFGRLGKLNLNVSEPEELEQHGTLQGYDKTFDRINTRTTKPPLTIPLLLSLPRRTLLRYSLPMPFSLF